MPQPRKAHKASGLRGNTGTGYYVNCSCGYEAPPQRFPVDAVNLWGDHLWSQPKDLFEDDLAK